MVLVYTDLSTLEAFFGKDVGIVSVDKVQGRVGVKEKKDPWLMKVPILPLTQKGLYGHDISPKDNSKQ
jgi:hypothetical protein